MHFTSYEDVCSLKWEEDITLRNTDNFKVAMTELLTSESRDLLLNFNAVSYINSAGLGIIADSVMSARKNQKELVISEIQDSIKEIFNIVKFSSFIKFFDTDEDAIHYFKRNVYE